MNKYIALFHTPVATMDEWMKSTNEETRKAAMEKMMQDWGAWTAAHAANIVDQGSPLNKTKHVDTKGVSDIRNDLNYIMTVQADSHDAAAALFTDNPHIVTIPDSFVEVIEMPQRSM